MSSNSAVKMDVDNPLLLKRSSSAPMINEINTTNPQSNANITREPTTVLPSAPRPRRFSTSFSPLAGPSSPKLTPRVNQLRREESVDVIGREAAHERELNSTMVMSQSWEDLTLVTENSKNDSESKNNRGVFDPLHLNLPVCSPICSSPSPTRTGLPLKQCFSPSVFKTSLSPSPTRKFATRRSQSPIAMRPSTLGPVKRKFELDEPEPLAKRGGLLIAQSRLEVGMRSIQEGGCEPLPLIQDQPMSDMSKTN